MHTLDHRPVTDPRSRNPRTLASQYARAAQELRAAQRDERRLRRRDPRRAARAHATVTEAQADVARCLSAIQQAGGTVIWQSAHPTITDRRGRPIHL